MTEKKAMAKSIAPINEIKNCFRKNRQSIELSVLMVQKMSNDPKLAATIGG
jgi:hypothetical protein